MSVEPYGYAAVCPTCGAKPDERCRTRTTRRVTDMHAERRGRWTQEELDAIKAEAAQLAVELREVVE